MSAELAHDLQVLVEFTTLAQRLASIPGWLREFEGYLLYRLARDGEGLGEIVEIGSWMGRSTAWLAAGSKAAGRGQVHAVDTFTGSEEHRGLDVIKEEGTTYHRFAENLERVELFDHVAPEIADSRVAAARWPGKPIRLLFIDGDHSYESVQSDFDLWSRHVVVGGLVAFDDVTPKWPGVLRCFNEVMAVPGAWEPAGGIGKVKVIRKLK
jgi:predicted O-methyltransferase YrrM